MEINWKISAVFASAALIVSIASGLLGGVGFGLVIVRALVGAILFALIGGGISLAISKFLPELLESNKAPSTDDEAAEDEYLSSGSEINIVLPDENPHVKDDSAVGSEDFVEVLETVDEANDGVEEIAVSATEEPQGPPGVSIGVGEDEAVLPSTNPDELVEEVEEVSPIEADGDMASIADSDSSPISEFRVEGVDALPDIGSLSGTDDYYDKGSENGAKEADSIGIDQDPAVLAQAVQTLLKKDQ
jgi:hypothetical protein